MMNRMSLSAGFAFAICFVSLNTSGVIAADNNKTQTPARIRTGHQPSATPTPSEQKNEHYKVKIKMLTPEQLETLLNKRFRGDLGMQFGPYANMFMVKSMIELGVGVGLTASQAEMEKQQLEPAFPSTYQPTFREFLDALALQTDSRWSYQEKDQFATTYKKSDKPVDGMIVIMFEPNDNAIGYEMTPAHGWQRYRRTNWMMFVPPTAPVGMDFHVCGKLSAPDKTKLAELLKTAPADAALDFYKRIKPDATKADLKSAKVGPFDSYHFETWLPPNGEPEIHLRMWYFVLDNQLCYVISTLKKDQDNELYPDVEKMIDSFHKK